jgi:hypothetical protein
MGGLASSALRGVNAVLKGAGLQLQRVRYDFEDQLVLAPDIDRLCGALSDAFEGWARDQTVIAELDLTGTRAAARDFYDAFLESPFRHRQGGTRFNNLTWLHLLARAMRPDVIIDSGTFRGASAWALATGAPAAEVISFDPNQSNITRRTPGVRYVAGDWTTVDVPADGLKLCYFDDHIDQVRRVIEAARRGIQYAVFDDDFQIGACSGQIPGDWSLPKLEFALDPEFAKRSEIVWNTPKGRRSWTADHEYLGRGRSAIAATERLPNTSLITGVHQTPYRVVRLANALA